MKTRTLPVVSDGLVVPKPAPGENVYPIYSEGVICGYVCSGGNQKKPKIFLKDHKKNSGQNTTKAKGSDIQRKHLLTRSQITTAKGTATKTSNPNPNKDETVSLTDDEPSSPNTSEEPEVSPANHDNFDVQLNPIELPYGVSVDLEGKVSVLANRTQSSASEVQTPLVSSPAKNLTYLGSLDKSQNSSESRIVVAKVASAVTAANRAGDVGSIISKQNSPAKGIVVPAKHHNNVQPAKNHNDVSNHVSKQNISANNVVLQSKNPIEVGNLVTLQNSPAKNIFVPAKNSGNVGNLIIKQNSPANNIVLPAKNLGNILPANDHCDVSYHIVQQNIPANNIILPPKNSSNVSNLITQQNSQTNIFLPAKNHSNVLPANNHCDVSNLVAGQNIPATNIVLSTRNSGSVGSIIIKQNSQAKNPTDVCSLVTKQNSNPQSPTVIPSSLQGSSSSSSVINLPNHMAISANNALGTKQTLILPRPNQPLILTNTGLQPTNWLNTSIQPNLNNTVAYLVMPSGPLGQGQVYLASSTNHLSTILPSITTPSQATTIPAVNHPIVQLPSTGINSTIKPPVNMIQSQETTQTKNQLLATTAFKGIVPKSTYVQMPVNNVLGQTQSIALQPQILKLRLVNKSTTPGTASSPIPPVNSEGASNESVSSSSRTQNKVDPAVTNLMSEPDKTIDSNTSANSDKTNESEASGSKGFYTTKGNGLFHQFSLVKNKSVPAPAFALVPTELTGKQPRGRGRPKKILPPENLQKRVPVPILPATQKDFDVGSFFTFSLKNTSNQKSFKPQAGNSPSTPLSSSILVVDKEIVKKPLSASDTQNIDPDLSAAELTEDVIEITDNLDLNKESHQTNRTEDTASVTQEKTNHNSTLTEPVEKWYKTGHQESLPIPGHNMSTESNSKIKLSNSGSFNLLPSGNYVLGSQSEGTCDRENEEGIGESTWCNSSLREENEMPYLPRQDEVPNEEETPSLSKQDNIPSEVNDMPCLVRIKTEPPDYDSDYNQEKSGNSSDNCASSSALSATNIQTNLKIKEEKETENESISVKKEKEDQLVISSCFSLSDPPKSDKNTIPPNSVNSDFDNPLPGKIDLHPLSTNDLSDSQGSNSENISQGIKLKECPVKVKSLELLLRPPPGYSLPEDDIPDGRSSENSSPISDEADPSPNLSSSSDTKVSLEALAKTILDKGCLKKLNELNSSLSMSSLLGTRIKRPLETSVESALDEGSLKKFKGYESANITLDSSVNTCIGTKESPIELGAEHSDELNVNNDSIDTTLNTPVNISESRSTGLKRSLELPTGSFTERLKRLKENFESNGTKLNSLSSSIKKSLEIPAKSNRNLECLKKIVDRVDSVNSSIIDRVDSVNLSSMIATEIERTLGAQTVSVSDPEASEESKYDSELVVETEILDPSGDTEEISVIAESCSDDASENVLISYENYSPSNHEQLVVDLTEDDPDDSYIENCIELHEQSLYSLQLQMDKHREAIEKLKKQLTHQKATKAIL